MTDYKNDTENMSILSKWASTTKLSAGASRKAWVSSCLSEGYGYPIAYINERLSEWLPAVENAACTTFSLIGVNAIPYAIFAIAHSDQSSARAREWICQTLEEHPNVQIALLATEGSDSSIVIRKNFYSQKIEDAQDFQTYSGNGEGERSLFASVGAEPLSERVEALFFEAHCRLRDIDGLHPDEALDELCKIIYTKLFDEKETREGRATRFSTSQYACADECASSIRSLFTHALDEEQNDKNANADSIQNAFSSNLRLSSPAVLALIRSFQPFSFGASKADIKGRAFQKVLDPTFRQGLGQYFTPEPIVRLIVESVCPKATDRIIDPFCGSGHFLSTALSYVRSKLDFQSEDEQVLTEHTLVLDGIEKSERMVRVAVTDVRLTGDTKSKILLKDALLEFRAYKGIAPGSYDLVLTNPPFGSILSGDALDHIARFELAGSRGAPLEVLGLERSVQLLKPGGRLAIVLPDGILANSRTLNVRNWLARHVQIGAIVSLPIAAFSPFGANIKTSIIFARKLIKENLVENSEVLMLKLDEIGYDSAGRRNENSEVNAAVTALSSHFQAIGW